MTTKRENWKGKYYSVTRKNGKISSRSRWHQPLTKKQKEFRIAKREIKKKAVKFNRKSITDVDRLSKKTGIFEIRSDRIFKRLPGCMVVSFRFLKGSFHKDITTSSNKMYLASNRKLALDQCYQRALAQFNESPDRVIITEIKYFYWIKNADKKYNLS